MEILKRPSHEYVFPKGNLSAGYAAGARILLTNKLGGECVGVDPGSGESCWTWVDQVRGWDRITRTFSVPVVRGDLCLLRRSGLLLGDDARQIDLLAFLSLSDGRVVAEVDLLAGAPSILPGSAASALPSYAVRGEDVFCHSSSGWIHRLATDGSRIEAVAPLPGVDSRGMVGAGGDLVLLGLTRDPNRKRGEAADSLVVHEVPSGRLRFRYDPPAPEGYSVLRWGTSAGLAYFQLCAGDHEFGPDRKYEYVPGGLPPERKADRLVVIDLVTGALRADLRLACHIASEFLFEEGKIWFLGREEVKTEVRPFAVSPDGQLQRFDARVLSGLATEMYLLRYRDTLIASCDMVGISTVDWETKATSQFQYKCPGRRLELHGNSLLVATYARRVLRFVLGEPAPKKTRKITIGGE